MRPRAREAIAAQADALDAFAIEGIRHNIPFLAAVMAHPRFQAGKLSTGFIAEEFPDGFHRLAPTGETAQVLAAVAAAIDHVLGERKRSISGQMTGRPVRRERRRAVWLGEKEIALDIVREDGASRCSLPRRATADSFSLRAGSPAIRSGAVRSRAWRSPCRCGRGSTGFDLSHRGVETTAFVYTEREAAAARLMPVRKAADTGKRLLCPMPGLVVAIAVAEGQEVKAGETLAVVEAMKMENVLRAERDGVVKAILVKPGDSLAVDAVIMEFA